MTGRNRIARGRAQPGSEEDEVGAGAGLRGHAFNIVARRAQQGQPGVVAYCGKSSTSRTGATPPLRAAPADLMASVIRPSSMLPGEGFISKPGMHRLGARGVGLHQVVEALGELIGGAAVDQFLLDAVELRKFGEDGFAAEFAEQIGDIAEGWIGGDAAESVGAAALEARR